MKQKSHISANSGPQKQNSLFFQPKLSINQPNDIYEQEADAMADKVMRMKDPSPEKKFFTPPVVQRKCAACEEEEKEKKLQKKEAGGNEIIIQRQDEGGQQPSYQLPPLLPPLQLRTPYDSVDYLGLQQTFFNRGLMFPGSYMEGAQHEWGRQYQFYSQLGFGNLVGRSFMGDTLKFFGVTPPGGDWNAWLANTTTPLAVDSALSHDFPNFNEQEERRGGLPAPTIINAPAIHFKKEKGHENDPSINIQKKCAHCEEEEKMQRKESNAESTTPTQTENYINTLSGGNKLNSNDKNFFESRIGYNFSDVRIHNDSAANQSAKNVNALAYTHGSNIVFGSGQYQPSTDEGKKLLAHELTHVVQQNSNLSTKTIQRQGMGDVRLSEDSDRMLQEIQGLPAYTGLDRDSRRLADEIISVVNTRSIPTRHYFLIYLRLLFRTPEASAAAVTAETNANTATAVTAERTRVTRPAQAANTDLEERASRDPSRRWTRIQGQFGGGAYYIDRTSPANIVIRAKIFLHPTGTGTVQNVNDIKAMEDGIEKAASAPGYLVDIQFVNDTSDADTFSVEVDPSRWEVATNWSGGNPTDFAHELHHMFAFPLDRYNYAEAHSTNQSMRIPDRLHWFRQELNKPAGYNDPTSIMNNAAHPNDNDICTVAGLDLTTCMEARRRAFAPPPVQRKCADCEAEEKLQRKEGNAESTAVTAQRENYISTSTGGRSLNAEQIIFNSGKYQPHTDDGKKLPAHELTHVVQQHPGNRSIQRVVTPASVQFHSFSQLRQMLVPDFIAYIQRQADWFTNPSLTDEQRQHIRQLLYFINDNVAAYFSYVRIWLFDDLINNVTSGEEADENADALHSYASAASGQHIPFAVSGSPVAISTALEKGKDMVKLRRSFPDYVLHDALNETQFLSLRNRIGFIDDVINYHDHAQQQPTFQAADAADFNSFIIYNQAVSRHPLQYESTPLLNKVRNFHRFQKRALDRLVTNYGDHSHVKPLTLILHSGLDHNGAFHQDPNLTAVITNNHMLTLMIEGFEQLSGYQSLIGVLANGYGQQHGANFLIDQVMFAGHGNAQLIQLAGTIHEDPAHPGHIEEINRGLNVRSGQDAATRSLLQDVLSFMANPGNGTAGMSPHNRVVFNACLTGSNRVAQAINNGNPATASTEIQTFINANPSLSTYLHNMADPSLTSVGSRASFGQVSLINAADELNIISADDPALTSASPLTYAERGTEPTGTLRSALESWANDRPGTIAAMQRRVTHAAATWDNKLIKKAYEIILASYQNNGESFRLITVAVDRISEMKFESSAIVPNDALGSFHQLTTDGINADASTLLNALTTTSEWNNNGIRLALLQVWMVLDVAKQADFMTRLATLNCNFSVRFVDIGFLAAQALMNTLLTGAASDQAKFRLALIGVLGDNNNADARTYLTGQLAGAQHFSAALNITAALGGASTETAILTKLGVFSAPVAGAAPQVGNVHTAGSATNTIFVERVNVPGTVSNPYGATVYEQPDSTSNVFANLNFNDPVEIIGRTGDFYAIQFSGGGTPVSAFISRFSVDQLAPYTF